MHKFKLKYKVEEGEDPKVTLKKEWDEDHTIRYSGSRIKKLISQDNVNKLIEIDGNYKYKNMPSYIYEIYSMINEIKPELDYFSWGNKEQRVISKDLMKRQTQMKIQSGDKFEQGIIELAKDYDVFEKLGYDDFKIDKNPYYSEEDDRLVANIDGYLGKDINHIDYILEVKNTDQSITSKRPGKGVIDTYTNQIKVLQDVDIDTMLRRYISQMIFYNYFFNVKKGSVFLLQFKGWKLVAIEVKRNKEVEGMIINYLKEVSKVLDNPELLDLENMHTTMDEIPEVSDWFDKIEYNVIDHKYHFNTLDKYKEIYENK